MPDSVQYVTNEQGDRIGVLLDLEMYHRLTHPLTEDAEYLTGLNPAELSALADMMLAPPAQSRLDALLTRNAESALVESEIAELDQLLDQVDSLSILKTRARYTLNCLEKQSSVA